MSSRSKKLVSMLCVVAMLVSALPVSALAAGENIVDGAHSVYTIDKDTQIKETDPQQVQSLKTAVMPEVRATPGMTAGGWFETLYAEIAGVKDADVTDVSWTGAMEGTLEGEDFEYLVRDGSNGVRIDIPGLTAGTYSLTVTTSSGSYTADNVEVLEYDRSGYAHFNYTEGVGAYRDDGVLKENAIVLYVTDETKDTVTVTSSDGTTVTGIGHILNSTGRDVGGGNNAKGGKANDNQGILTKLAEDGTPLVVRIVGDVKNPQGTTAYDSVDWGGSVGDNGAMARMASARDVTIEGIGADATINGWGFHFMAHSEDPGLDRGKSFEVRNVAFRNVPEDCIGMEGQQETSSQTLYPVQRGWVHNCSFYKPTISNPAESDKAGGDGACDFKRGEYFTMDYNYFEGYHKTNLIGASKDNMQYHITWHHNYWKDCEARGPLARQANIHIYNCLYESQSDYAMDARAKSYIFSEYNMLLNCTRASVTSKEGGGTIKSFNDAVSGTTYTPEATVVTDKNEKVSSSNKYASFELDSKISYIPSGDYKLDKDLTKARANIMAYAGTMKTKIVTPEEVGGSLAEPSRTPTAAVALPYDKPLNSANVPSTSCTQDNIIFNVSSVSGSELRLGKNAVGQDIVFMVDQAVDITITDGGASTAAILLDNSGKMLVSGSGTATNCPAGVYIIQSGAFNKGQYKEAKITHLTIKATQSTDTHTHSWSSWSQTVAPTCTREGVEKRTCSCGEIETRAIAKIAHDYQGGVCAMCGVLEGTFGGGTGGEVIEVTGLKLDQTEVTLLQTDQGVRVIATVEPANATKKTVTWTSSDASVATVSKNGTITPKGFGVAEITASISGFSKSVIVKVIGVQSDSHVFLATDNGDLKGQDTVDIAAGSALVPSYYTSTGANKWKAKDSKNSNYNTRALLLGLKEAGAIEFTVADETSAKVSITFTSTSKSNRSAIALLDSSGKRMTSDDGHTVTGCLGNGSNVVNFSNLASGVYKIVSPANVTPEDIGYDGVFNEASDPNNPNLRGAEIIKIQVVEEKPMGEGNIIPVDNVTLSESAVTAGVGESVRLTATVTPADATLKTVNWETSNRNVATVSGGVVTARGEGTATITATAGGKKAACTITVTAVAQDVTVTSVTLNKTAAALTVGGVETLTATVAVTPNTESNKAVTWSSDKPAVATVDANGKVIAVAAGTAVITATSLKDSSKKATCTVTVTAGAKPVSKDALNTAIDNAQLVADSVAVDTDAANVPKGSQWVLAADKTAFTDAIAVAQAVAGSADATQAQVDAAVETLSAAVEIFAGKWQDGAKEVGGGTTTEKKTVVLDAAEDLTTFAAGAKKDGDSDTVKDYFTIYYSAKTKVEDNSKKFDGYDGTRRINFSGSSEIKNGSAKSVIKFTTSDSATVKVFWAQGGEAGSSRNVAILAADGTTEVSKSNDTSAKNAAVISTLNIDKAGTYYLVNVDGNNPIYRVEVTETTSGGDTPAETADKTALKSAIDAAKAGMAAVTVSNDGSDVETTAKWVTQADKSAYNIAVIAAQAIANNANATQAQVDKAVNDLAAATAKFESVKQAGTKGQGGTTPGGDDNPGGSGGSGGGGGGSSTTTKKPTVDEKFTDTFITIDSATKDNVAVAELTDSQAKTLTNNAVKNNSHNIVVTVNGLSSVATARLNVSAAALQNMANKTNAALTVQTSVGDVKIPGASLADLGGKSGKSISVLVGKTDGGIKVTVAAGNQILDTVAGGVTAVTEASSSGSVAVLVAADGSEKLLKKSYVEGGRLHANLPGSGTIVLKDNTKTFRDVDDSWAKDAIGFATSRELFNGVNQLDFAPNQAMTRAMLVTVLYRLEGATSKDKSNFRDVSADTWYTEAVAWASANGIVSGKMDNYFGPDDDITREQLATILYRYATKLCGMDEVSEKSAALEKYPDAAVVSGFAEDGMKWAVEQGIISGRGEGTLAPGGFASRAEVATMLMRFVKAIV